MGSVFAYSEPNHYLSHAMLAYCHLAPLGTKEHEIYVQL